MDLLTQYPEAYPVPDKSVDTVAKVLTDILIPTHFMSYNNSIQQWYRM